MPSMHEKPIQGSPETGFAVWPRRLLEKIGLDYEVARSCYPGLSDSVFGEQVAGVVIRSLLKSLFPEHAHRELYVGECVKEKDHVHVYLDGFLPELAEGLGDA